MTFDARIATDVDGLEVLSGASIARALNVRRISVVFSKNVVFDPLKSVWIRASNFIEAARRKLI